jgi:peroxiredoxin
MSDPDNNKASTRATRKNGIVSRIGLVIIAGLALYLGSMIWRGSLLADGSDAPLWTLPVADGSGQKLSLQDLRGKVVVLDFWSTTCAPCMKEMKELEKIQRRMKELEVVVIGVACGGETLVEVTKFGSRKNVEYRLVVDKTGAVSDTYLVRSLPTIYVIDRDGKIADSNRGFWGATDVAKVVNRALE